MIEVADSRRDTEVEDILGLEEEIPFKYSITSYGADFTLDGLVRRIQVGDIVVPTFQRGYVWNKKQASLLIESFLMGLPVPGIFLSQEEDQTLLVIDGQQRLRTLQYFYEGLFGAESPSLSGKKFALTDVSEAFEGKTCKTLSPQDRRQLDNSLLHATIVKQNEPEDDNSSIYLLFERLNTQGVQLQPQEIRNSIYRGAFNEMLKELNANKSWRHIFGRIHSRAKDQELILRFLALYFDTHNYSRPMKQFLNDYMDKNQHLEMNTREEGIQAFVPAIEFIDSALGRKAFRPTVALNAAVYDAVMVAVAKRLKGSIIASLEGFEQEYDKLLDNEEFISATRSGTTDVVRVRRRLDIATAAFADVG
ncbi:MAG: DUF262 domain-containing protein [Chloroflexi bacterium]|nr:DUF262 domain-containing protein [Chloroflexota bacterium]